MTHLATCLLRYRFYSCVETSLIIIHLDCYLDGIANILFSLLVCYLLKFVRTLYCIAPLLCLYLSDVKHQVNSCQWWSDIFATLESTCDEKLPPVLFWDSCYILTSDAAEWNRTKYFQASRQFILWKCFFHFQIFFRFSFCIPILHIQWINLNMGLSVFNIATPLSFMS